MVLVSKIHMSLRNYFLVNTAIRSRQTIVRLSSHDDPSEWRKQRAYLVPEMEGVRRKVSDAGAARYLVFDSGFLASISYLVWTSASNKS